MLYVSAQRWPYACLKAENERFANNCVVDVDRFGEGNVLMWDAISHNQRTSLVIVPDNLPAQRYRDEILSLIFFQSSTRRERFFSTTTQCRTEHVLLSTFLLISTSLCYPGYPDPKIWIPLSISGINWINMCACVNQPPNSSAITTGTTIVMAKNTPRQIQRLNQSMRRQVTTVLQAIGIYTRYWYNCANKHSLNLLL